MNATPSSITPTSVVAGEPLYAPRKPPMQLEAFLRLAARVACALAELHQSGVVHRNIKPDNILIESDSQIRFTDLSIATRSPRDQALNGPRFIEGTLAYMSPEQTGRMNRRVDSRSDLYSLGVTFYQMLTGQLPFQASDALGWVHCHIARMPEPPNMLRPELPAPVSDVVMKLLAKAAEDRYQSASGLQHDLTECMERLTTTGRIDPFPLGQHDTPDRLQIPQRLYGRDAEIQILLDALGRVVAHGKPELLLVSGYSGVGKSALVGELQRPIVRERGFFVSGKFDQYRRNIPYATISDALRQLVREILSASDTTVAAFRRELVDALGGNGQVVVDVIPEVELIIGKQAPVPELSASEAQNRFNQVFLRFMQVLARREHPVAIFLDDLQWVDAATLSLLKHVATHPDVRYLLIIGAYRDNEVNASHPLMLTLEDVRAAGAAVRDIVLAPLSPVHTGRFIADTLKAPPDATAGLADVVQQKTAGNPFFTIRFMLALQDEDLLQFDLRTSRFRWDAEKIKEKQLSDNVVDLLVRKLSRLPIAAQDVLKLAACIGNRADLQTLTVLSGRSEEETRADLREAEREGMVFEEGGKYRFLHDRVQQAAYSLIPEEQRKQAHLRIGRLLLAHAAESELEESLFDIVNQFNQGAVLISEADEKLQLAELNLAAGRRARASAAYAAAASYFAAGNALLDEGAWEARYQLIYDLHIEQAVCEQVSSNFAETERLLSVALSRSRTKLHKANAYVIKTELHVIKGEMSLGVQTGIECLSMLGMELPARPTNDEVQRRYWELRKHMGDRKVSDLIDLPPMTDPEMRAAMRALSVTYAPAFFTNPTLAYLVVVSMVDASLSHGMTDAAGWGYVGLGAMLTNHDFIGDYAEGYEFGQLACRLVDKHGLIAQKSKINFVMGAMINPWTQPAVTNLTYLDASFRAAPENGDLLFSCYSCNHTITTMLTIGEPLDKTFAESERRLEFARKCKYMDVCYIITGQQQFIRNMRGLTKSLDNFSDADLNQDDLEARMASGQMPLATCWYYILKMQARFLMENHDEAVLAAETARGLAWATPGVLQIVDYHYYAALIAASAREVADAAARLEEVRGHEKLLGQWADSAPQNFRGRHDLVSAEIARLTGRDIDAMALYERAIRGACDSGFVHDQAVANEIAARFYASRGAKTAAIGYLREARTCYARWGADGKVKQLEGRYPELTQRTELAPTATFAASSAQLDLLSVIKASQSISSEIVLPRLMEKLMHVVIEEAGAQRGYFIRLQEDALLPEIRAELGGGGRDELSFRTGAELSNETLPLSILNYVKRTREALILADATVEAKLSEDEYFARQRPKSVLCLPLVRQSELVALLYLENDLAAGAFTADRLAVLEILASQMAISLENATLYAQLERENADRRRAEDDVRKLNEHLERRVLDRTAQLSAVNRELEAFSYSVSHDLRAPLRTIDAFTQALADESGEALSADARGYLGRVRSATQRSMELIADMLKLAQVTRGELLRREIDLSTIAREIAGELLTSDGGRQVEFVIADKMMADGDERLVRIVLENLLGNAWKFTGRNGRARIEVGVMTEPGDRQAYFVRDDGAGFDAEYASKLFRAFQRLHTTDEFPGTGIGLATVQRIVNRHGGRIWAEGAVGKGATFYFTL